MVDIYKERIKPLFDKSGLMNKDLESEIGIPEKKISDWNAGRLKSYDKYIPQIASYFHVSTDYLLGNTDNPEPAGQKETPPENQEAADPVTQELYSMIGRMSRAELILLLERAERIIESRG